MDMNIQNLRSGAGKIALVGLSAVGLMVAGCQTAPVGEYTVHTSREYIGATPEPIREFSGQAYSGPAIMDEGPGSVAPPPGMMNPGGMIDTW